MAQDKNSPSNSNPSEIYEQVFIPAIMRHWTPILLEFAQPRAGEHILDLACGTGIVARNAAKYVNSQGRIVGLDINPAMLEVARQQVDSGVTNIEWQEGNAENIPFPDRSFDLVLCQAGLMLFKNKIAAANEMRRVLKAGGRAVALVWQSLDQHPFNKTLCTSWSRRLGVDITAVSPAYSLGSVEELNALLAGAGFSKVAVYPVQYYIFADDPELFLDLSFKGAAAAIPSYANLDDKARSELAGCVASDIELVMKQHMQDGRLIIPRAANIAVARV
jgi:ubiquinone/menaquinone biosynthesis C-methylase UbiE